MIKNDHQHRVTQGWVGKFEAARRQGRECPDPSLRDWERQMDEDGLTSQLEVLQAELAEYDALKSGRQQTVAVASFLDLPRVLIQGRIAAGMTQRQLADRLGLKEQQVQRYEATDYESASLTRLGEVAFALGVQLEGTARLTAYPGKTPVPLPQPDALTAGRSTARVPSR